MQVINGGQTCKTIQETLNGVLSGIVDESAYIMVRIFQLAEAHKDFVQNISGSSTAGRSDFSSSGK